MNVLDNYRVAEEVTADSLEKFGVRGAVAEEIASIIICARIYPGVKRISLNLDDSCVSVYFDAKTVNHIPTAEKSALMGILKRTHLVFKTLSDKPCGRVVWELKGTGSKLKNQRVDD